MSTAITANGGSLPPITIRETYGQGVRHEFENAFEPKGTELLDNQSELNKFTVMLEFLKRNDMSVDTNPASGVVKHYVDIESLSENLNSELARSNDLFKLNQREADYELKRYNALSARPDYAARMPGDDNVSSSQAHIESLQNLIRAIHKQYQSNYGEINKAAAEFMKDINILVGKFSAAVSPGSDNKLRIDEAKFIKEMSDVLKKYTETGLVGSNNKLNADFPGPLSSQKPLYEFKADDTELKFWQDKLQPGFTVEKTKDGKIGVYADLKPLFEMARSVVHGGVDANINGWDYHPSVFQAIQSAIDSQKNAVNNAVSQLVEKFRQDNGSFDNLIQMLSKLVDDLFHYNQSYFS